MRQGTFTGARHIVFVIAGGPDDIPVIRLPGQRGAGQLLVILFLVILIVFDLCVGVAVGRAEG
ncbi:hypothetical protein D3C84_1273750 [compost metagenome]